MGFLILKKESRLWRTEWRTNSASVLFLRGSTLIIYAGIEHA